MILASVLFCSGVIIGYGLVVAGSVDTQRFFKFLCGRTNFFWCVGTVGGHRLRGFSVSVVVVVDEWGLLLCF